MSTVFARGALAALPLLAVGCHAGLGGQGGAQGAAQAGAAAPRFSIVERGETGPVTTIAFRSPILYAGTARGLKRWDVKTDEYETLGAEAGLPGHGVTAVGIDGDRNAWVATEAGVGRLVPAVKGDKGADAHGWKYQPMGGLVGVTVLAPTADGNGAWAGGADGLFRSDGSSWSPVPELRGVAVTSLDLDADGRSAWVGTRAHGLFRAEGERARPLNAGDAGAGVDEIVGTALLPSGTRVAAARALGAVGGRLIILEEGEPQAFRASPDVRIVRLVDSGKGPVLIAGPDGDERAYTLKALAPGEPPPPGGLRFVSVKKGTAGPRARDRWAAVPLDAEPPRGVTVAAGGEGAVYYGTSRLGVARGAKPRAVFLSGAEIVGDAERMSVACASSKRCFVVTDGPNAWVTDGDTYRESGVGEADDAVVLAVVSDAAGTIYSLSSEPKFKGLVVARLAQASTSGAAEWVGGDQWKGFQRVPLVLPAGTQAGVSFASISPEGVMWIGLRARTGDDSGDDVGIGAVELDLASHRAIQHGGPAAEDKAGKASAETLPLPPALTGVTFDPPGLWFSSLSGVLRWQQGELRTWGENEGLRSELTFGVARVTPELLWAATSEGVARFDGKSWRMLGDADDAVVATRGLVRDSRAGDGVWIATSKGLRYAPAGAAASGGLGEVVVEGDMHDVHVDRFGRVWALSSSSIALVTPNR